MSDILEFPTQEARAFAFLERELRQLLVSKGADDALVEYAVTALTSVYSEAADASDYGFSVNLPVQTTEAEAARLQQQIGEGIDAMRAHHHHLVLRLAARLLLAEMRLFQHERVEKS